MESLKVASPADFHTHLRQGELMRMVTPHVEQGGFDLAYVMASFRPLRRARRDVTRPK
jgi:dihydroorotase